MIVDAMTADGSVLKLLSLL